MSGGRILYLHQHFSTPAGSTATRSHAFARALAQAGHAVTMACGRYAGAVTGLESPFRAGRREGWVDGFRVVEFDIPCGNAMALRERMQAFSRYAGRASALALRGRWDLVVASSTPLTVAISGVLARRLRGTPFLFEIRDPWPELPAALGLSSAPLLRTMTILADAACREAAAVVTLTDGVAELAAARGARRIEVIPQGADLDLFGPAADLWRPEGVGAHELLAVYAGAHGPANGLRALLDAAEALRGTPIRIALVGEGPEKPALQAEARRRDLCNLLFLDAMPKPRLAGLLAGADAGLICLAPVPAFAEWAAPNKLTDLLAAGRPVLSNLGGPSARLLEESGAGLAVPAGDGAAFARALRALAADPAWRARMGTAARAEAARRFDRRLLAARFVALAEAAMARRPALAA